MNGYLAALLFGAVPMVPALLFVAGRLGRARRTIAWAEERALDLTNERDRLSRALRFERRENAQLRTRLADVRQLVASPYRNTLLPPAPRLDDEEGGV